MGLEVGAVLDKNASNSIVFHVLILFSLLMPLVNFQSAEMTSVNCPALYLLLGVENLTISLLRQPEVFPLQYLLYIF